MKTILLALAFAIHTCAAEVVLLHDGQPMLVAALAQADLPIARFIGQIALMDIGPRKRVEIDGQ